MKRARFILPNAFTSMNFLLGAFSICWSAGMFNGYSTLDPFRMGAYFVLLSVLCDKLDGFAARLVDASSEFGAQFDSLGDLVGFGLAPAFCVFFSYKANAAEWLGQNLVLVLIVFAIYILCAAMRLAKYNAMDGDTYHHHFSGLPSTFAGAINMIFLSYMTLHGLFNPGNENLLFLPILILLVTGLMMVAPCFLPKLQPHSNKFLSALQIVLVVITYLSGFFFITSNVLLQNIILTYLMILCGSYVVIGFTLGFIQRSKIIAEAEAQKKQNEAA